MVMHKTNRPENRKKHKKRRLTMMLTMLFLSVPATALRAEVISVAVASNFYQAISVIKQKFESSSEHRLLIVNGSTGKLYAQIINGAPFDVFMAADSERPQKLQRQGLTLGDSRFTYAIGQLVLWCPAIERARCNPSILTDSKVRKVALANPKLAPYGKAAMQLIGSYSAQSREKKSGSEAFESIKSKLVFGQNVSQAYHLVASGSAEVGFVALSLLEKDSRENKRIEKDSQGNNNHVSPAKNSTYWTPPNGNHSVIEQQLVVLKNNAAVAEFVRFLQSPAGMEIIRRHGYQTSIPEALSEDY